MLFFFFLKLHFIFKETAGISSLPMTVHSREKLSTINGYMTIWKKQLVPADWFVSSAWSKIRPRSQAQLGARRHAEKIKTGKSTAELTRRQHVYLRRQVGTYRELMTLLLLTLFPLGSTRGLLLSSSPRYSDVLKCGRDALFSNHWVIVAVGRMSAESQTGFSVVICVNRPNSDRQLKCGHQLRE